MKTVEAINKEAETERLLMRNRPFTEAQQAKQRLEFLKMCVLLCEGFTPERLKAELVKTEQQINKIKDEFGDWCIDKVGETSKLRSAYYTQNNMQGLRRQLKMLRYICE
jgi:hypothetical protein